MKQLPAGSSVCDQELNLHYNNDLNNGISNFLMMKRQDICDDSKVNNFYRLRVAYDKATGSEEKMTNILYSCSIVSRGDESSHVCRKGNTKRLVIYK